MDEIDYAEHVDRKYQTKMLLEALEKRGIVPSDVTIVADPQFWLWFLPSDVLLLADFVVDPESGEYDYEKTADAVLKSYQEMDIDQEEEADGTQRDIQEAGQEDHGSAGDQQQTE